MPVKIKHKQLGDIKEVSYHEYFHNINKDLWSVLSIWDIAELYNSNTGTEVWQATIELQEAIEAVKKHPNIFRYELSKLNTKVKKARIKDKPVKKHDNSTTVIPHGKIPPFEELVKVHNAQKEKASILANDNRNRIQHLSFRLSNKKFVLKHVIYAIKKGIIYGKRALVGVWKFIVLVAATFLGGWLSLDHNFRDMINWIKNFFSH